jgi:hypothetical protein
VKYVWRKANEKIMYKRQAYQEKVSAKIRHEHKERVQVNGREVHDRETHRRWWVG